MKKRMLALFLTALIMTMTVLPAASAELIPSGMSRYTLSEGVVYEGSDYDNNVLAFSFTPLRRANYCFCAEAPEANGHDDGYQLYLYVYDQNGNLINANGEQYSRKNPRPVTSEWLSLESGISYSIRLWDGRKKDETESKAKYSIGQYTISVCSEMCHADIGEYVLQQYATCEDEGIETRTCSRCGMVSDTRITPATGHVPGEWQLGKNASCSEEGFEFRRCSICQGIVETRVLEKVPHTLAKDWTTVVEPTCTQDGWRAHLCTVCGEATDEYVLYAHGHTEDPRGYVVETLPTCTECGIETLRCTECNQVISNEMISPIGHTYGEWYVENPASGEETVMRYHFCIECGCFEEESYELSEELWTCTECGNFIAHGNYCFECGSAYSGPQSVVCVKCGKDLGRDYSGAFCSECGNPLK